MSAGGRRVSARRLPPFGAEALVAGALFAGPMLLAERSTSAQEEESTSPNIDLGSSRIGGPGLTERERSAVRSWDEPEEYVTEETLPDPGSPKRLPSLHVLAERYHGGGQWNEACRFYQMILDEAGQEGLTAKDGAPRRAARAFYECAVLALGSGELDAVETNLVKAEQLGFRSQRTNVLRRKVVQARFRDKLRGGDVEGAHRLYDQYQGMGEPDEDERIWFGEELGRIARGAFEQKDQITFRETMDKLEVIAPLNPEYRALKDESAGNAELFRNIALVVGSATGAVLLLSFLSSWRARARVGRIGQQNPYLDDDEV